VDQRTGVHASKKIFSANFEAFLFPKKYIKTSFSPRKIVVAVAERDTLMSEITLGGLG